MGNDIYSFCFVLCQKKSHLRAQKYSEFEIPSDFQVSQVFLTMIFASVTQVVVSYVMMKELPNDEFKLNISGWASMCRFVCILSLHFEFAADIQKCLSCLKYLITNYKSFKYVFRALCSV